MPQAQPHSSLLSSPKLQQSSTWAPPPRCRCRCRFGPTASDEDDDATSCGCQKNIVPFSAPILACSIDLSPYLVLIRIPTPTLLLLYWLSRLLDPYSKKPSLSDQVLRAQTQLEKSSRIWKGPSTCRDSFNTRDPEHTTYTHTTNIRTPTAHHVEALPSPQGARQCALLPPRPGKGPNRHLQDLRAHRERGTLQEAGPKALDCPLRTSLSLPSLSPPPSPPLANTHADL